MDAVTLAAASKRMASSIVIWKDSNDRIIADAPTGRIASGTDASTVIQAAIEGLPTTGGRIFFRTGKYTLTSTLTWAFPTHEVVLEGEIRAMPDGQDLHSAATHGVIFDTTAGPLTAIAINQGAGSPLDLTQKITYEIRNILFQGSGKTNGVPAILSEVSDAAIYEGLAIREYEIGIDDGPLGTASIFTKNVFVDIGTAVRTGGDDVSFTNNNVFSTVDTAFDATHHSATRVLKQSRIVNNFFRGTEGRTGVLITITAGEDNLISDNYLENGTIAVELAGACRYTRVDDNIILDAGTGILVGESCSLMNVNNNVIKGAVTGAGIESRGNNVTISGNLVGVGNQHGIYINDTSLTLNKVTINGNTVVGNDAGNLATYDGIYAKGGSKLVIVGNTSMDNDRYEIHVDGSTDVVVAHNMMEGSDHAGTYQESNTPTRVIVEGVGQNGANDPAAAGDWFGNGEEGIFVKWSDGTDRLSLFTGGAWMTVV